MEELYFKTDPLTKHWDRWYNVVIIKENKNL